MELTLITDSNGNEFEEILFMENHTLGLPVISAGVLEDGRPIAAGSMDIDKEIGRIISVYTEEPYREKGAGKMILREFEKLASSLGLKALEADFVTEEKGTDSLFSSCGYRIFDGTGVNRISLDEALDSVQVKNYIEKAGEDLNVVPFNKLTSSRCRGMISVVDPDEVNFDTEGLSRDLSAFALGQYDQPVGYITIREHDCDIIIDALRVADEKDEYVAALLGHLYNMLKIEKGTGLRIGFVANNDHVMDRVGEIIGDLMEVETGMKLFHAVKFI